jgi:hypothetical protein
MMWTCGAMQILEKETLNVFSCNVFPQNEVGITTAEIPKVVFVLSEEK